MPLTMPAQPVYLTSFGHHSACGNNLARASDAIIAGHIPACTRHFAGSCWPYNTIDLPSDDWQTGVKHAICAVGEEIRAGLTLSETAWREAGFFLASSIPYLGDIRHMAEETWAQRPFPAQFARQAAEWLGIHTQPWCIATACTSSLTALDAAAALIRAGKLQHALILGVELPNQTTLAGFAALGLISPDACRPFDKARNGLVLGEAIGGVWLSHQPCGQGLQWQLLGIASTLDTFSATGPDPSGAPIIAAMRQALAEANLSAGDIDLIKLHAAGSPAVDQAEATALHQLFTGNEIPPLWSPKANLGHTLGASGAVELSALTGCLAKGVIPATAGFATPDSALALQPTTVLQRSRPQHILFNLIGFGGSIAALALGRIAS
ncbi:MAG: hypothetical protein JNM52_05615 [Betaproteobacteria bacterium]|nr:hypothetical protein [Betaproteobacteria bacterium]